MKILRFAQVLSLSMSFAALAAAEPRQGALLRLTAMVSADFDNGTNFDKGAAIITAQQDGRVYLVTARHVVQRCTESTDCAIKVKFQRGNRDAPDANDWRSARVVRIPAAEALYRQEGDLYDLAGLVVEDGHDVARVNFEVKRNARPGAANDVLHAEGYVAQVPWAVTESGRIATSSARLQFGSTRAYEGASGGAIFNVEEELIGMAQNVDGATIAVVGIRTEQIEALLTSVQSEPFPVSWDIVKPALQVTGDPEARFVLIDSQSGKPNEYRVPGDLSGLPMGTLRFDLVKSGYVPASVEIKRREDVMQRVEYRLVRKRFPWAATSIIAGGAVVLSGLVFGALAWKQHSDFNADPSRTSLDSTQRLNTVADVLFATGTTLLATGVILHFSLPTSTVRVVDNE